MTASRRFGVFAIAFAAAYSVIYVVAMHVNFALFTYHPALGEFGFGANRPRHLGDMRPGDCHDRRLSAGENDAAAACRACLGRAACSDGDGRRPYGAFLPALEWGVPMARRRDPIGRRL
jgi:hypothetical protein